MDLHAKDRHFHNRPCYTRCVWSVLDTDRNCSNNSFSSNIHYYSLHDMRYLDILCLHHKSMCTTKNEIVWIGWSSDGVQFTYRWPSTGRPHRWTGHRKALLNTVRLRHVSTESIVQKPIASDGQTTNSSILFPDTARSIALHREMIDRIEQRSKNTHWWPRTDLPSTSTTTSVNGERFRLTRLDIARATQLRSAEVLASLILHGLLGEIIRGRTSRNVFLIATITHGGTLKTRTRCRSVRSKVDTTYLRPLISLNPEMTRAIGTCLFCDWSRQIATFLQTPSIEYLLSIHLPMAGHLTDSLACSTFGVALLDIYIKPKGWWRKEKRWLAARFAFFQRSTLWQSCTKAC